MNRRILLSVTFLFAFSFSFAQQNWFVRAIQKNGNSLEVKAYTDDGRSYPIQAIVMKGNHSMLDLRMMKDGKQYPVKVKSSQDSLKPVVAIMQDGKALTLRAKGPMRQYKVYAMWQGGKILNIKAMAENGRYLAVKAISPKGKLFDVKGVKMTDRDEEGKVSGTSILAHVKALPQMGFVGAAPEWSIRAIGPKGEFVPVMAVSKTGDLYPIKGLKEPNNNHLLNVKADVKGEIQPVKVMITEDAFLPIAAINEGGEIMPLKAFINDTTSFDVKAYSQTGNVIHIKAVGPDNKPYGVKAIAPNGILFDVKGLIFLGQKFEGQENGVNYKAHVKAIPQAH